MRQLGDVAAGNPENLNLAPFRYNYCDSIFSVSPKNTVIAAHPSTDCIFSLSIAQSNENSFFWTSSTRKPCKNMQLLKRVSNRNLPIAKVLATNRWWNEH